MGDLDEDHADDEGLHELSAPSYRSMLTPGQLQAWAYLAEAKRTLENACWPSWHERYEALLEWLADEVQDGPWSFIFVCDILDIEPSWARRRLLLLDRSLYRAAG